jgi:two-component sensor histidine kinase/CHASE1-domain containing sensor protein
MRVMARTSWLPPNAAKMGLALLAVVCATAARVGLDLLDLGFPSLAPFYLSVLLSVWFGGWMAGGMATILGGLVVWWAFLPPTFTFKITIEGASDVAVYVGISVLAVTLIEAHHRQQRGPPLTVSPRLVWIAATVVTLAGIALTTAAAIETYLRDQLLARAEFDRLAEKHAQSLQSHLKERETLARIVSSLVRPAPLAPDALAVLDGRFFALAPDIVAIGWTPRVEMADVPAVLDVLAKQGVTNPRILGPDLKPFDLGALNRPLYPILDIRPRGPHAVVLGVDVVTSPERLAALEASDTSRSPFASAPIRILQDHSVKGVVLFTPADDGGPTPQGSGFLGITFRFDRLFAPDGVPFAVLDEAAGDDRRVLFGGALDGDVLRRQPISFGGRTWTVTYAAQMDLFHQARLAALKVGGIGAGATALLAAFMLFVLINSARLQTEVAARKAAESSLQTLVSELRHRVKNMLAVVQTIVTQTLRPGTTVEAVLPLITGRLLAMAHAVSMLSNSGGTIVPLRALLSPDVIPVGDRIEVVGPDIEVDQHAGQALALLFYELATNAAKHGALSTAAGTVRLKWSLGMEDGRRIFRMRWEETGGPTVKEPQRSGFGRTLISRITPATLGGHCDLHFFPTGFVYELDAPAERFRVPAQHR